MKKYLIIFCFLFFISFPAFANSGIVIVRGQDFPPYHFIDQSGAEAGFVIEIIQSVVASINMQVKFKQYPWSRCLLMVEKGRADAMMNLFKTKERMAFMHFSENVIAHEVNRFFKLKNTPINYSGELLSLSPFKIGAIRNYSYGQKFDQVVFPKIFRLETEENLVKSLVNKRCDIILGNADVMEILIKKMGVENIVESISPTISNEPLFIGFSKAKGHKELSDNFSKALGQFKTTRHYTDILKKYN